jgi:hypothetical protein
MTQWLTTCDREPTLKDMLDDPIVHELMARDGVARADVEELMAGLWITPDYDNRQAIFELCACTQSQERTQCAESH